MPRLISRVAAGLLMLSSAHAFAAAPDDDHATRAAYQLGQGLEFPDIGLNIGGYINLQYADLHGQRNSLDARDLSLFLRQDLPHRWKLFAELEFGDALTLSDEGASTEGSEFDLERLYADYHAAPSATFRLGKFLTPIGRWNLIHAAPLEWTVSRPLATSAPFARHSTGLMIYGAFAVRQREFDYALFVDGSELLDPRRQNEQAFEDEDDSRATVRNAFDHAAGGHVAYHFMDDSASVGLSVARMELRDASDGKTLIGVDAIWSVHRMELSGEWVYRDSSGEGVRDEHGGYIQAVIPVSARIFLIGRHERYKAAAFPDTATINVAGITFRPLPAVALKLEYRDGDHNGIMAPSGWLGSLAVLF